MARSLELVNAGRKVMFEATEGSGTYSTHQTIQDVIDAALGAAWSTLRREYPDHRPKTARPPSGTWWLVFDPAHGPHSRSGASRCLSCTWSEDLLCFMDGGRPLENDGLLYADMVNVLPVFPYPAHEGEA